MKSVQKRAYFNGISYIERNVYGENEMSYVKRLIQSTLKKILERNKSVMLLGPRQTGKTTLADQQIKTDLAYSFLESTIRRRFENDPDTLIAEIKGFIQTQKFKKIPIVLIDEVQKIPKIMDVIQFAIDQKLANFILTGSSTRKLRRGREDVNLLPGRVIELHLSGLSLLEMSDDIFPDLEDLLLNGSLPEILLQGDVQHKELLLTSYVNLYLEEEIRAEALVKNLSSFSRFLTYAAVDAGKQLNMTNLSREIGITRRTIEDYYQILEDCLIADRIDPVIDLTTRRRLTKSPKYLLFDLGIRRIAAGEGLRLPQKYFSELFEQFIGMEILKLVKIFAPQAKCRYWRDHAGPEVDYVIEYNRQYLPIEVKWTSNPTRSDGKHLLSFMKEYECALPAYIVCQTSRPMEIAPNIIAISWKEISVIVRDFLQS